MEAAGGTIGGLTAHRAQGPGAGGSASAPAGDPFGVPSERGSLETCLALLKSSAITAAVDAALWNFQDASDFACRVEEISRTAEYLQLVAAHAVERARNEAMPGPSPAAGQGAFIRRPRHGLHHLEIFATTDQFENLVTVMNSATNPRTSGDAGGLGPDVGLVDAVKADAVMEGTATYPDVSLDHRCRAQKQLDGLVGACKSAMASASLPANGGFRPQVLATIDYRDLLAKVLERQQAFRDVPRGGSRSAGTASLVFTGPVNAATIRKIACDADIIPVVLGSEGRVLDIGRTSRIFPPHIRKAVTARDQGCAFPGCTIPAPWCEAHHIQY